MQKWGGQYVHTIRDCEVRSSGIEAYNSCITISDTAGNLVRAIVFDDKAFELPPKLSPSGKYVAYNDFDRECCHRTSWLYIDLVADVSTVDSFEIDIEGIGVIDGGPGDYNGVGRYGSSSESPMDWLPNDQLVYTVPSDFEVIIYITKPGSLDIAKKITVPDLYQGDVESLDVSPDGTQLLIGYDSPKGLWNKGVLLLDLDTLDITVPAIDPGDAGKIPLGDDMEGYVYAPRWSPDGKWIMVLSGQHIVAVGAAGAAFISDLTMYAVPADKSYTVLTQDEPTEAIAIRLVRPDKPEEGPVSTFHSGSYYEWVD